MNSAVLTSPLWAVAQTPCTAQVPHSMDPSPSKPIELACAYSHYVNRWVNRWQTAPSATLAAMPNPLMAWSALRMRDFLHETLPIDADEAAWMMALRQLRNHVMVSLVTRDLSGQASLAEVMETMTCLAEVTIQAALASLTPRMEAQYGQPIGEHNGLPQTLLVAGMGKLGGRELNVSSDIDLIFLYEEEGETQAPALEARGQFIKTLSNHEFFTRLGRKLLALLGEVTGDGFVFRVDMRLRPNGDAGPLVCSLAMLETYLLVQGREWERYAWIKGRVVSELQSPAAQRTEAGLMALISPFVYRRYLDFGVIAAIRDLHTQIRAEASRKAHSGPAWAQADASQNRKVARNIKLGHGGIREIEFTAQVFQLMRGGQDSGLRVRPTLHVLTYAAQQGLLPQDEALLLCQAYVFLRNLEHRLQYIDDAQTHQLPVSAEEQAKVAGMMGFPPDAQGYQALLVVLERHTDVVWQQFSAVFSPLSRADKAEGGAEPHAPTPQQLLWSSALLEPEQQSALCDALVALGYAPPNAQAPAFHQILDRLKGTWQSTRLRSMGDSSRHRFSDLVQHALVRCAQTPSSSVSPLKVLPASPCLLRVLDFLEAISRRASYLALLTEYPQAFERLCDTLAASRWAAHYLTLHPQLLDELLLPMQPLRSEEVQDYWSNLAQRLRVRLAQASDNLEDQLDVLRQVHQAETFRILLQDMQGSLTVETIGDRLSELADMLLRITLQTVWQQLPQAQGRRAEPAFAVIAYGKLGGKELGYASDLDIIFLYDDAEDGAGELYAVLARKLILWLTTHTPAGTLFEVDTRLRPNGEAGLLVTSVAAFERYQLRQGDNTAWVWEHQALTRARFSAGDSQIGTAFEKIRHTVLTRPRDAAQQASLREAILAMRERMVAGHPNRTEWFDLKHDRGGMVDIEFIVQYLVLRHAAQVPALCRNAGNIALLREAAQAGLLAQPVAEAVGQAYRTFRALQHTLRLDGVEHARVSPEAVQQERAAVLQLWRTVFETQD